MAPRLTLKRMGAAVLGASLVLMTAALPALAEPVKVEPNRDANEEGIEVYLEGHERAFDANLLGLTITQGADDKTARAYCVELPTLLQNGTPLQEVPWDQHPNPTSKFKENSAKINWILHHSYPLLEASALNGKTGREIDNREAIAGTQAAIWHFSDDANLRKDNPTKDQNEGVDADVWAVYQYLIGEQNTGEALEPDPTLDIKEELLEGKAGERIGPFTVSTTADKVTRISDLPAGVKLTDKDGNELPSAGAVEAKGGPKVTEIWVEVAQGTKPGEAAFTLEANAELRHGRLFVSEDYKNHKTQSLIIAQPSKVKVKDSAKAKWTEGTVETTTTTPAPTTTTETTAPTTTTTTTTAAPAAPGAGGEDDLASTGASIFVPLLIGLGLLGAGAAALIIVRRKKTA